ncbi:uncharacterized protein LOC126618330 [Malus sylvestris]|uniref:uncharacterized protein LOC126618330 n=1 Tax=Malus sylvestris TaxID=3752 RepID=UPI0021ACF05E|nr:uncharacterized protein LOC126618330 [Malus sylvestris]
MNPNSMNLNTVKPPTGVNYKKWKQDLETTLGVMDMDLALTTEEPPGPTDDSTSSQRFKYEKWHKSNRISLLIIKRSMTDVVRGAFIDATNAKDFLKSIEQKYKESPETETDATNTKVFLKFIEQKYKESPKTKQLKALEVPISENFIVHVIKNSLPDSYSQLKVSYNALRDKWDANELIAICEERMKKEKVESVNLMHGAYKAHKSSNDDVARKDSTKMALS